jgi:hypothetical protein
VGSPDQLGLGLAQTPFLMMTTASMTTTDNALFGRI